MLKLTRPIALAVVLAVGATGAQAKAPTPKSSMHQAMAPTPKISMHQARATALKLAPGRIISSGYEKEGGIGRYSFDVQQRGNVQEIGIDGRTGKIVENKSEGKVDRD